MYLFLMPKLDLFWTNDTARRGVKYDGRSVLARARNGGIAQIVKMSKIGAHRLSRDADRQSIPFTYTRTRIDAAVGLTHSKVDVEGRINLADPDAILDRLDAAL
jgi:hypothetical protein